MQEQQHKQEEEPAKPPEESAPAKPPEESAQTESSAPDTTGRRMSAEDYDVGVEIASVESLEDEDDEEEEVANPSARESDAAIPYSETPSIVTHVGSVPGCVVDQVDP